MSTTPVIAPEAPQAPGPINHFARIIGVFFSPTATFEDIAKRPSWILPVVLMTVLGAGVAYGFGIAWPILQALIVGGVLLLAYNVIGGASARFGVSVGITAHAYFPWILYSLLFILILYLKAPGTVDLDNPVATNLGAFLPESTPKALMSLGKSIDIFSIWMLLLIAMGFTAVNPKKLKGKSLSIAISVWAIYVAIKMGGAWIFS